MSLAGLTSQVKNLGCRQSHARSQSRIENSQARPALAFHSCSDFNFSMPLAVWAPPVSHLLICVLGRQQDILWPILARNEGNSAISSLLASGRVVCVSSRVRQESARKTLKSLTGVRCTHSTQAAETHGLCFWFQMELTVSSRVSL